jgi:ubiquitin-like modifier-activating enzyme ATG7
MQLLQRLLQPSGRSVSLRALSLFKYKLAQLSSAQLSALPTPNTSAVTVHVIGDAASAQLLPIPLFRFYLQDIHSGAAVDAPQLLQRCLLLSFADLKKSTFLYWMACPALVSPKPFTAAPAVAASLHFTAQQLAQIDTGLTQLRGRTALTSGCSTACPPYFVIVSDATAAGSVRVLSLREYEDSAAAHSSDAQQHRQHAKAAAAAATVTMFGMIDPCPLAEHPGWPLRNLLMLLAARWDLSSATVLCWRSRLATIDCSTADSHDGE